MHPTAPIPQIPSNNPMRPTVRLNAAPRCHARSRRSGNRCRGPALRGSKVCRMHGARGGAPRGNQNAVTSHRFTGEARAVRLLVSLANFAFDHDARRNQLRLRPGHEQQEAVRFFSTIDTDLGQALVDLLAESEAE
jgi:hypothetical protein